MGRASKMSSIRIISSADVKALFTLPMAIEAVERAYLQKHTKQGGVSRSTCTVVSGAVGLQPVTSVPVTP